MPGLPQLVEGGEISAGVPGRARRSHSVHSCVADCVGAGKIHLWRIQGTHSPALVNPRRKGQKIAGS